MIQYKSEMYTREQEGKTVRTSAELTKHDWEKGVEFASNTNNRGRVFESKHNTYYILSAKEAANESRSIDTLEAAVDLYLEGKFTDDFKHYVENVHQRVYELIFNSDCWTKSTCTCPYRLKKPICKHITGISLLKNVTKCPPEANPTLLSKKIPRGRPPLAKNAYTRQNLTE